MIYFANWKMNGLEKQILEYVETLSNHLFLDTVILALPFPYLKAAHALLSPCLHLGAQDLSHAQKGAYTGSVSGEQLRDVGCEYVIIGHSERRQGCFESNDLISHKLTSALQSNLIPVVCVGEKEGEDPEQVLTSQLESLKGALTQDCIIAYEPVWAIGTGKTPTTSQISRTCAFVHSWLKENGFENISILYGGSVTPENSGALKSCDHVSGFLVGGACLKADSFYSIITSQTA